MWLCKGPGSCIIAGANQMAWCKMNGILGPKTGPAFISGQGRKNQGDWKPVGLNRAKPIDREVK